MLSEFDFLGRDQARKIVVENPNDIACFQKRGSAARNFIWEPKNKQALFRILPFGWIVCRKAFIIFVR
jgi:DNA polymerase III alpha subunit (gram-positive type)